MIGRNIQCFEIIIILLDLRAFHNLIAHADEDPLNLFERDFVRMTMSEFHAGCRKRDIDDFRFKLFLAGLGSQRCLHLFQLLCYVAACFIDNLTEYRPFFFREITKRFHRIRELSFLAEESNTDLIELRHVLRFSDLSERLFLHLFEFVFVHLITLFFIKCCGKTKAPSRCKRDDAVPCYHPDSIYI